MYKSKLAVRWKKNYIQVTENATTRSFLFRKKAFKGTSPHFIATYYDLHNTFKNDNTDNSERKCVLQTIMNYQCLN